MTHHWEFLTLDERLVLCNVPTRQADPVHSILRRVREQTPRTSSGTRTDFGERRLRKTLRSLEAKNLVVCVYRTLWQLHLEGVVLMDESDVRKGLRERIT